MGNVIFLGIEIKNNNNIEIVSALSCDEIKFSFEFFFMRFDC